MARSGKFKILVVDDVKNNLEILKRRLSSLGYEVFTADNGKKGLKLAEKVGPDLILLDIEMPVMDGYEVLEKIRAHGKLSGMPVVAVTAAVGPAEKSKLLDEGFDEVFLKPLKVPEIVKIIESWFQPVDLLD